MKFWTLHSAMVTLWTGAIVMGLVYFIALKSPEESAAFIIGQVVLGSFGLAREMYLKRNGFKSN